MSITITIQREGQFAVNWTHSHNHQCGNVGTSVLFYKVVVRGSVQDLNNSGWLLDNNDIPAYFNKQYSKVRDFRSCEEIARRSCEDFANLVRQAGGRARYIAVSVSGISGSLITCEWEA